MDAATRQPALTLVTVEAGDEGEAAAAEQRQPSRATRPGRARPGDEGTGSAGMLPRCVRGSAPSLSDVRGIHRTEPPDPPARDRQRPSCRAARSSRSALRVVRPVPSAVDRASTGEPRTARSGKTTRSCDRSQPTPAPRPRVVPDGHEKSHSKNISAPSPHSRQRQRSGPLTGRVHDSNAPPHLMHSWRNICARASSSRCRRPRVLRRLLTAQPHR